MFEPAGVAIRANDKAVYFIMPAHHMQKYTANLAGVHDMTGHCADILIAFPS